MVVDCVISMGVTTISISIYSFPISYFSFLGSSFLVLVIPGLKYAEQDPIRCRWQSQSQGGIERTSEDNKEADSTHLSP